MRNPAWYGVFFSMAIGLGACSEAREPDVQTHALLAAPTITPSSGKAGDTITISGTKIGDTILAVYFPNRPKSDSNVSGPSFTRANADSVTVQVPAGTVPGAIWGRLQGPSGNVFAQLGNFTVQSDGAPTIATVAKTGSLIKVTGTNFTGTTSVTLGGLAPSSYTVDSNTQISFSPPAVDGTVTVVNDNGSATSSDSVTYAPPPAVTSIAPLLATQGDTITITGTGLDTATKLTCGNNASVTMETKTSTQITFLAPAGRYVCTPTIFTPSRNVTGAMVIITPTTDFTTTGFSPTTPDYGQGITVTGDRLGLVVGVEIAGQGARGIYPSDDGKELFFYPPYVTSGSIKLISTFGSQTLAPTVTISAAPTQARIESVSPRYAQPGDTVTIRGVNFTDEPITAYFPSSGSAVPATATFVDSTTITVVAPTFDATGSLSIQGSSQTVNGGLIGPIITAAPTLTGASPTAVAAGDTLTLTGTNLLYANGVRIGASWGYLAYTKMTELTVYPSVALSGSLEIEVFTPTGAVTLTQTFDTPAIPTLATIAPTTVPPGGTVTLTGTNLDQVDDLFVYDTDLSPCSGTCDATCFCVVSPTQITFAAPLNSMPSPLFADHAWGTTHTAQTLTISDGVPPVISYVSASALTTSGVKIFGDHFAGLIAVEIGGVMRKARLVSNEVIELPFQSSDVGAAGKVRVTTVAGSVESSSALAFTPTTYSGVATITKVEPATPSAGELVTITGTGLAAFTSYTFEGFNGGAGGPVLSASDTEVRLQMPYAAIRRAWLRSSNASIVIPLLLASEAPVLVGFSPSVVRPGDEVVLFGLNFQGPIELEVGGQLWGPGSRHGNGQFRVPFDAVSGPVKIKSVHGDTPGVGSLTIQPLNTTLDFLPATVAPGETLTITGASPQDYVVDFGGSSTYVDGKWLDATTLQVTVPARAKTGVIKVGTAVSKAELRVSAAGTPEIYEVATKSQGDFKNRRVFGLHLTGTRRVSIGGRSLSFTIDSDRQLTVSLPSELSNDLLVVETAMGRAVSTFSLEAERPQIASMSKTTVAIGDTVTLTGLRLAGLYGLFGVAPSIGSERTLNDANETTATFRIDEGVPSGAFVVYYYGGYGSDPIALPMPMVVTSVGLPTVDQQVTVVSPPNVTTKVRGQNFGGLKGITVGGEPAMSVNLVAPNEVSFSIPYGAASGPIEIENSLGKVTAGQYTAPDRSAPAATLTKIEPAYGPPGIFVTFTGTHLDDVVGARIGTKSWFSLQYFGGTTALFVTDPELSSGEIELVMNDGRVIKTGQTWISTGRLALIEATPTTAAAGGVITVQGDGFLGVSEVTIGGVTVDFTVVSNSVLEITAPDGEVSGTIVVTKDEGETSTSTFTVTSSATLDLMAPLDLSGADMTMTTTTTDGGAPDSGGESDDLGGVDMGKGKSKGCAVGGDPTFGSLLLCAAIFFVRRRRQD